MVKIVVRTIVTVACVLGAVGCVLNTGEDPLLEAGSDAGADVLVTADAADAASDTSELVDAGGDGDGDGDDDGSVTEEPPPPPWVEIVAPADGGEVPNPVTFQFTGGDGVETVWLEVDEWPLQDDPIPLSAGSHIFRFVGVNRARSLVIEGRNAAGETVATDAITFTPIDSDLITRCEVLQRGQAWVDDPNAWYSWNATYTDPTTGVCCYRPDCSGMVSAVWGLDPPGHTTYSFAMGPWDDGVSYVISAGELLPGDALNYPGNPSAGTGHIMLYVSGDFNSGYVEVMEEYGHGNTAERRWRTIDPSIYYPIRYVNIVDGDLAACGY